jgi:energy-coupling factor transporter ATP-binding protein EcfA2
MQGPSIEFADVGLALGNTTILEDVNFTVRPGTVHCIVGANGGGKTSLVRSMVGQMPHSGRITIQWQQGRGIGYVPQTLDFDKSLPITVSDFMAMTCQRRPVFLGVARTRRKMIGDALDQTNPPVTALRNVRHYVYNQSYGYDGAYYVQLALYPTLENPELAKAIDNLPYRARRILFSWVAWLVGLGQQQEANDRDRHRHLGRSNRDRLGHAGHVHVWRGCQPRRKNQRR